MGWGRSSRAAAIYAALAVIAVSTPARAQESDVPRRAPAQFGEVLELQFGGGYLFRNGDLASLPSVEVGVVLWWSESWGGSLRRSTTVGEHMASYNYRGGTRTGGRSFRHWTGTLRYRHALHALDPGLELNVALGLTIGAYDHLTWHHGPRVSPRPRSQPSYIGGLASEVLVGKRITPRLRIKAGLVAYPLLGGRPAVVPVAFGVVSFFLR